VSILYCAVPHFSAALARRDDPNLDGCPLILFGPEGRVFGTSAEAAACNVAVNMTAKMAEIRCPEARLLEADVARCRDEFEDLLQLLERSSPHVEPCGWGAAYIDLGGQKSGHKDAVIHCQQVGRAVRRELGETLQPALGWDNSKFTAQAAARRTHPGHLLAVDISKERNFLQPLSVALLPLSVDVLQQLYFLGLRTLGQYAALPSTAIGLQFGRAGQLAHRCARGEDDRPVIPRQQALHRRVNCELDAPEADRERLLSALQRMVSPALAELREGLKACGQICLIVDFDDGSIQERARTFLFPTADEALVVRTLGQLLEGIHWRTYAVALAVVLEQLQDVVVEQLSLFAFQRRDRGEDKRKQKLREVQRYLVARFGANRLQRAVLARPGAPLPEWRVGWLEPDE
jgi:nucleotidyltransferase/DNA polymerase involved in DNA repair